MVDFRLGEGFHEKCRYFGTKIFYVVISIKAHF